jgi:hypothetical protein
MKFWDTETCGLHGPIVLIQYADGIAGEIKLHSVWNSPIGETLDIFDSIIYDEEGHIGFNITFDWFHLVQMYTTLALISRSKWDEPPDVEEYAALEPQARFGPCIKPMKSCDLMLHARRGPYQSTMERDDIRIKRIPTPLAWQLADELEGRVQFKDIYFARKKDKNKKRWEVKDIEKNGKVDPDFKDIILKFAASSALKTLATDALKLDPEKVLRFKDVDLPKRLMPKELGYAPFACAIGEPGRWNGAWPDVIRHHISHWSYHETAREYAKLDVEYLQKLWPYFGSPEPGDDDSELACMLASCRWRGYQVNIEGIKKLKEATKLRNKKILTPEEAAKIPFLDPVPGKPGYKYLTIPTKPSAARRYIREAFDDMAKVIDDNDKLSSTTKKAVLEEMVRHPAWKDPVTGELHPAAKRAKEVLEARQAGYEEDFYDKIIQSGRFHASSSVTGSLSGRMSGGGSAKNIEAGGRAKGDGLNPLGVKRTKEVRGQFGLADLGLILCGGDFSSFEVGLAEAVYDDQKLRSDLQSKRPCSHCKGVNLKGEPLKRLDGICKECGGKGLVGAKIHALFGQYLFPHLSYDEIVLSAGSGDDYYERSKRGFFAVIYGAEAKTLNDRIAIPIEQANEGLHAFRASYLGVAAHRQKIINMFCSMRQPGGIGSNVEWHEPSDFIEAKTGFRRYFTLENMICKTLFNLACDPPKAWFDIKIKVVRRDRMQTATGAVRSALYAAAFAIQAANLRAAANHEIQSFGAIITKKVQRKIWDLQPSGVSDWMVQPLNVHDEIQCPTHPSMVERVAQTVKDAVESFRPIVPLIKMDWQSNLNSWADKS